MVEKIRFGQKSYKHWVAHILFGAIILVFALWGVRPDNMGGLAGGVAAVVNTQAITVSEYRSRLENIEQNARFRFDQFPEAQRKMLVQQLRQRALEDLILGEVVFQSASSNGVGAGDGEVRSYILEIPFLQENGQFKKDRYRAFLQNMNLSSADFERQVRKQVVSEKLQNLFIGSVRPTREEMDRLEALATQKLKVRFAQIDKADLKKLLTDADVKTFIAKENKSIADYYENNKTEFTDLAKVKARHILVRIDEKRSEGEALKIAKDLRAQVNRANFAEIARKHSDDPGSKEKGGDLGEFSAGRMVPAFEEAAFALKAGEISDVVKSDFGYHIILVESKSDGGVKALDLVRDEIARRLMSRQQEADMKSRLNEMAKRGDKKALEAMVRTMGGQWQETGEFDLSGSNIPKLGEVQPFMQALVKQHGRTGLLPEAVTDGSRIFVGEVLAWNRVAPKTPAAGENREKAVAYQRSSDAIGAWTKEVETKARIERNPQIMSN